MRTTLRHYKFTIFLFVASLFFTGCATTVDVAQTQSGRDAIGTQGMVAAAHPLAAQVGVDILKAGGNAIDAAVAVGFSLSMLEPNASGLGGGGLMLIRLADSGKVIFMDFRERAPAAASPDMFELDEDGNVKPDARGFDPMVHGGRSIAVPGEVAGLLMALEKYGSMTREQVIQPAIDYAENGVQVSTVLANIIAENYEVLSTFPASSAIYLSDGFPKVAGETIVNPDLANSFRTIIEQGADGFYSGPIAQSIVDAVQADGGLITMQDMATYEVSFREPVTGTYRGYEIVSASPPSSGGAHVIELLNIMENYDLRKIGFNSAGSIHIWAEAMKLMYADRAVYMGDSDFTDVPLKALTSKQYARTRMASIDPDSAAELQTAGDPWPSESGSTTHFSVVDSAGNMVACTKTINHFFASGLTAPGTGIILNDQMADFDKRPGQANSVEGGKKPLSSMTPTLLFKDGKPFASLGSPGGKRIITTVAVLISDLVDFDMDIQTAIDAPRVNNYEDGPLKIESRIPLDVQNALRGKGHTLEIKKAYDLYFGGAQGVVIDPETGVLHGGADPRRDGQAVGF